jgi:hypothetical protein
MRPVDRGWPETIARPATRDARIWSLSHRVIESFQTAKLSDYPVTQSRR